MCRGATKCSAQEVAEWRRAANNDGVPSNRSTVRYVAVLLIVLASGLAGVLAGASHRPAAEAAQAAGDGRIAFISAGSLQSIDPAGGTPQPITSGADPVFTEAWSPDGRRIAYVRAGSIRVADSDGSNEFPVAVGSQPTWSPDGEQIAFWRRDPSSDDIGAIDLWVHDLTTGSEQKITPPGLFFINGLAWSPDGTRILFAAGLNPTDTSQVYDLYTISPSGGSATDLTNTPNIVETGPDWSPDGSQIAFAGFGAGSSTTYEIYVVSSAGGAGTPITSSATGSDHANHPSWSPDGTRLAYGRGTNIHLVDATGENDTFLVAGGSPDWGPAPVVQAVEFTQGTQEYQTIGALQADLEGDGQPLVAIVEGKPAVMRIYMSEVQQTRVYEVEATGDVHGSRFVQLDPGCTPVQRRRGDDNCKSVDFYFEPPPGDWSTTIRVRRQQDSQVLEEHVFHLTSTENYPLIIKPVPVCDHLLNPAPGLWQCGSLFEFVNLLPLLRAAFPGEVQIAGADSSVFLDTDAVPQGSDWWQIAGADVRSIWQAGGAFDNLAYHGVVRPEVDAGATGGIAYAVANASASRTSVPRAPLDGGLPAETADGLLAHLIGRTYGRAVAPSSAGCYGQPPAPDAGWPYSDALIQETGFDVLNQQPIDEETTADVMGLCTPRWASPYTYNGLMSAFASTQAATAAPSALVTGDFWLVSGTIDEHAQTVHFEPMFELETEGSDGGGSGVYRLEVRDGSDAVLFTRFFSSDQPYKEDEGQEASTADQTFAETIPVQAGAASIVLLSASDQTIGTIELSGQPPIVDLSQPASVPAAASPQGAPPPPLFSWSVSDPDSQAHSFWVQYSRDGGLTWNNAAPNYQGTSISIDPTVFGGTSDGFLRVLASDGANTGSAMVGPFAVQSQAPTGAILSPSGGGAFQLGALVWLQAGIVDAEDGVLDGASVHWTSSLDGALGDGASLPVYDLSVGTHTITMSASDGDGHDIADSITISVVDQPLVEGEQQGTDRLWGDVKCDGNVNLGDAISLARDLVGLDAGQSQGCPPIGSTVQVNLQGIIWGDVDCSGALTLGDTIALARFLVGMIPNVPGCPSIASTVNVHT